MTVQKNIVYLYFYEIKHIGCRSKTKRIAFQLQARLVTTFKVNIFLLEVKYLLDINLDKLKDLFSNIDIIISL